MSAPKKTNQCSRCKNSDFEVDVDGNVSCSHCGLVNQEMRFDNNVVFGEQRQMVGKNINTREKQNQYSSEKRLKRAKEKIQDLRRQLQIDANYNTAINAAVRLLNYADHCGFFKKGKNIQLYAAAALYIALRFQKAPFLLIDFSDKMNVGLFKLARCYLKLSKNFGFQKQLPLIDPSLFIHRYSRMLNLGDKTKIVAMTAIRLIKRMQRDWMCQGRRPSSLCGAALLIATKIHKINNSNCSTTEICKTVFVCDETIRRRLDEFKQTKVSKLTPQEFEREEEVQGVQSDMDPPAFRKARLRSENEQQIMQKIACQKANKQKMDWDDENVPPEVIKKYEEQIALNYQRASDRAAGNEMNFDDDNLMQLEEEEEDESHHTGSVQDASQEENSDIDQKLVFLDEKQQKQRRQIWQNQNRAWIDKQASKVQRGETQGKRKQKKKKKVDQIISPFEAVKRTSLGQKINEEELKKLLASQPKIEPKTQYPETSLRKIFGQNTFNPFKNSHSYEEQKK